jgi:hypothetical protein
MSAHPSRSITNIGDYPAVSHALDVLGHNSRAPCHLCCFIRRDRIGLGSLLYYGHTTEINSRSTAFYRSVTRMQGVRAGENSIEELAALGFKVLLMLKIILYMR